MKIEDAFKQYAKFLQNLRPENIPELEKFVHGDVVFRDPFHEVKGPEAMSNVMSQMFNKLTEVNFTVCDHAIAKNKVFFDWRLEAVLAGKPWVVVGVTILKYSANYKIIEHVEHWDSASQFYERFPIIGPLIRYFRYRISK